MWGIEYDPIVDRSYVFQWFDSLESSQKTIYFEGPGRMLSIYFPTAFDHDGRFWILKEAKQQDPQHRGADPNAWRTAQVVIVQADRYPPYQVDFKSHDRLSGLELRAPESARILASQQKGWFFLGDVQSVDRSNMASKEGFELKRLEDGLWAMDRENLASGLTAQRGLIAPDPPTPSRSSRGFRSMGQDSAGEALVVDRIGRVARWNRGVPAADSLASWAPRQLSQLGWYSSIGDGAMVDSFRKYIPEPSIETSDMKKSSLVLALGEQVSGFEGFRADYWFCLPQGATIMLDEEGNSKYPDGTLFVQTISQGALLDSSQWITDRKVETRVLLFCDHEWFSLSYVWDAEQSDAELVESQEQIDLEIEGKGKMVPWRVLKPTGCFECHRNGTITRNPAKLDLESILAVGHGKASRNSAWNRTSLGTSTRVKKMDWSPLLAAGHPWPMGIQAAEEKVPSGDATGGQGVEWGWFKKSLVEENLEPWYRASVRPSGFFCTELDETLERFPDTKHGGYLYQVNDQGQVLDWGKDGYGHVFCGFR